MSNWQPIETAPKDGTAVLVWPADTGDEYGDVWPAQWIDVGVGEPCWWLLLDPSTGEPMEPPPTHWQPLPEPPEVER